MYFIFFFTLNQSIYDFASTSFKETLTYKTNESKTSKHLLQIE